MAFDPDAYIAAFDPDAYLARVAPVVVAPLRRKIRTCSRCGTPGHNARGCDSPDHSIADPVEREILIAERWERLTSPTVPEPRRVVPLPLAPAAPHVEFGWRSDLAALSESDLDEMIGPIAETKPAPVETIAPVSETIAAIDETPTEPPTVAVAQARRHLTVCGDGRTRAKTISQGIGFKVERLSRAERVEQDGLDYPDVERPVTRGDCLTMPRPCPFVSCRAHLAVDVDRKTGAIRLAFPNVEIWEMAETCSLDVADRGGVTLEEVGALTNTTRERARQVEFRALARSRDIAEQTEYHDETRDLFDSI